MLKSGLFFADIPQWRDWKRLFSRTQPRCLYMNGEHQTCRKSARVIGLHWPAQSLLILRTWICICWPWDVFLQTTHPSGDWIPAVGSAESPEIPLHLPPWISASSLWQIMFKGIVFQLMEELFGVPRSPSESVTLLRGWFNGCGVKVHAKVVSLLGSSL